MHSVHNLSSNHWDYEGLRLTTFDEVQRSIMPFITVQWQNEMSNYSSRIRITEIQILPFFMHSVRTLSSNQWEYESIRLSSFNEVPRSTWPLFTVKYHSYLYVYTFKVWTTKSQMFPFPNHNDRTRSSNHCEYKCLSHRTFDEVPRSIWPFITVQWQNEVYV